MPDLFRCVLDYFIVQSILQNMNFSLFHKLAYLLATTVLCNALAGIQRKKKSAHYFLLNGASITHIEEGGGAAIVV